MIGVVGDLINDGYKANILGGGRDGRSYNNIVQGRV